MLKSMPVQRRAGTRPPLSHQDEFPAEYSLAGCSPAEPASASSAMLILNQKPIIGYCFSANGNRPRIRLSQLVTQATVLSPATPGHTIARLSTPTGSRPSNFTV